MSITINPNDGLLVPSDKIQVMIPATPKTDKPLAADTIIIHYTAGSSGESSANWLAKKEVQASAHVVIDRSGKIFQIVKFDKIAWHAGESEFGGRKGFNNYSIGIELDNAGFLTRSGSEFLSSFGGRYPANEVIEAVHRNEKAPRFWHTYTLEQIAVCEELCMELRKKYPTITQILGHEEISPGRKQDPGPAFPLERFRAKLLQNNRDTDEDQRDAGFTEATVITDKLNIRSGAGVDFEKIAKPISRGKKLTVLGERNGWLRVKVEVEGWVSKAFVAPPNKTP